MAHVQISTSKLDPRFAGLFAFPVFNNVQSGCYEHVYRSDDNFVLSAPTGSGKTVVFELAICRLIAQSKKRSFKVVYLAPTKSLCSERYRDWTQRFATLGLRTGEFTGDSHNARSNGVQHTDIIIATPEKWDSITRKWKSNKQAIGMIKLLLIDEAHTLGDDRGATLEAVISRMKTISASIRFVALSATLPNIDDIRAWLGKNASESTLPAHCKIFGTDTRPVPLSLHVHGYISNGNDFAFEKSLTPHLPSILKLYSLHKPIMIFCSTRAACVETGRSLQEWWSTCSSNERLWRAPTSTVSTVDNALQDLLRSGIAFHHGGLCSQDRSMVEAMYIERKIGILCCTSTLATGVNLPCHMTIIKGTSSLSSNSLNRVHGYSDHDVGQMLGRAGRPQFDTSAVAVIMTKAELVEHYQGFSSDRQSIESRLHLNLIDHINAEIAIGSVNSLATAEKWLQSTFLYTRLTRNPTHYGLEAVISDTLQHHIRNVCINALDTLREASLIRGINPIICTSSGLAMANFCVQFDTVKRFMALPRAAETQEILVAVSQAAEFGDIFLRGSERQTLKALNHTNAIRFPLEVHIDLPWHKVYLVSQWSLTSMDSARSAQQQGLHVINRIIERQIHRLIRCLTLCLADLGHATALLNALCLARSLAAGIWEDTPFSMSQLDGIGAVGVRKLIGAGCNTIEDITTAQAIDLERVFSRNPPFGNEMIKKARKFPQLILVASRHGDAVCQEGIFCTQVQVEVSLLCADPLSSIHEGSIRLQVLADDTCGKLLHFQHSSMSNPDQSIKVNFVATLTSIATLIRVHAMCEDFAGTLKTVSLTVHTPADAFQTLSTMAQPVLAEPLSKDGTSGQDQGPKDFEDQNFAEADFDRADLLEFMDIDTILPSDDHTERQTTQLIKQTENGNQKLSNGRWQCNHACKNKGNCRHLCCREGLLRPPKIVKVQTNQPSDRKSSDSLCQSSLIDHLVRHGHRQELPMSQASKIETKGREPSPSTRTAQHHDQQDFDISDEELVEGMEDFVMARTSRDIHRSLSTDDFRWEGRAVNDVLVDEVPSHLAPITNANGPAGHLSIPSKPDEPRENVVSALTAAKASGRPTTPIVFESLRAFLGDKHFVFLDD